MSQHSVLLYMHSQQGHLHHSSLGANAPWKILGSILANLGGNIDHVNFQPNILNVIPNVSNDNDSSSD